MKISSINRQMLALAVPSIIANITTPLLALVDTAIVGHMGSAVYIAAIAVGGAVFNMLYWLFGFLRMGSSGTTAQEFGRGDRKRMLIVLHRALVIALVGGILIILFQNKLVSLMLRFMQTGSETTVLVQEYCSILIYGAPAVLSNYSLIGWFVGMQDSRTTMWISILINVVNISLSILFVYVFHLGIAGVAAGTLMAQWTGCLSLLCMVHRKGFNLIEISWNSIFNRAEFSRFFSINFDIFLRTLCLIAVTLWFTRLGSQQGTLMLAVNTLLMQFFVLFSYMMDGFAYAGEALAGRYIGASNRALFTETVSTLMKWGIFLALIFTAVYTVGSDLILKVLSNEDDVISAATEFRWWIATIPIAGFAAFTWDGVFVGATLTRQMFVSMLVAMMVFFVIISLFYPRLGNHGVWLAFVLYLATRGLVLTAIYRVYCPKIVPEK